MVLFIWDLLRHTWGARYIYKALLLSLLLGTTGVPSPPWVHMWLQMSLLEIKHSHHATFPNLSCAFYLGKKKMGGRHNPTKLPHSFAGLIFVLWTCGVKTRKELQVFVWELFQNPAGNLLSALRPSGVCGKIHSSMLWIKPLIQKYFLTGESLLVCGCKV